MVCHPYLYDISDSLFQLVIGFDHPRWQGSADLTPAGTRTSVSVLHVYRCRVGFEAFICTTRGHRDALSVKEQGIQIKST